MTPVANSPLASMTQAAIASGINYTGGKFAPGVIYTGGK
jgi:hypothetical protein